MKGFRDIDWAKQLWQRIQAVFSKSQWQNLIGTLKDRQRSVTLVNWAVERKRSLLYGGAALIAAGVVIMTGQGIVKANIDQLVHVQYKQEDLGLISNKDIITSYIQKKNEELLQQNPNVHMKINDQDLVLDEPQQVFFRKAEDQQVLAKLEEKLQPVTYGTAVKVDGKVIGYVKDEESAQQILDTLKAPYLVAAGKEKTGKVAVLSASGQKTNSTTVDTVTFTQQVELKELVIGPQDIMSREEMLKMLQTGGVQDTIYTVVEGDCISCIAKKLGISTQLIYDKNPGLNEDKLQIGQKLDVTVMKPTVSVKTEESVVENQDVAFDTEYVKDDSLRAGVTQTISAGKDGLKKVTLKITKINGVMVSEVLVDESVITAPVTAKLRKGTKVIQGEGTGKFAWPVISPSVSSTFGMRWGKLHKGIDITGNRNIVAADNGRVISTGYRNDYGNYITIDHLNGYETMYAHLSKISVNTGQIVEKGERIGVMGATGDADGVHLHFEIHKDGGLQNPLKYLNR